MESTLKGQSHEKVGEVRVWGVNLGHNFKKFSERPFNSCGFSKV
jgi:hypothetical protein